jgi:hypothetical protein
MKYRYLGQSGLLVSRICLGRAGVIFQETKSVRPGICCPGHLDTDGILRGQFWSTGGSV